MTQNTRGIGDEVGATTGTSAIVEGHHIMKKEESQNSVGTKCRSQDIEEIATVGPTVEETVEKTDAGSKDDRITDTFPEGRMKRRQAYESVQVV